MSPTLRRPRPPVAAAPSVAGSPATPAAAGTPARRRTVARTTPVALLRAGHPRLGVLVAAGLALAAALTGRSGREVLLVLATVLVGQAVLGWHNDLVDQTIDAERVGDADGPDQAEVTGKPIPDGDLEPGTVWFSLICAVLLLVPVAVQNGVTAGAFYLGSVAIGVLGNVVLRGGRLSWVPWAVAWALYPFFLSYGGWGGRALGDPPQPVMVALAALLGVAVHVLTSLPGLVADHQHGRRHLPLRIALRTGAPRLLVLALVGTGLVVAGLVVTGVTLGLAA